MRRPRWTHRLRPPLTGASAAASAGLLGRALLVLEVVRAYPALAREVRGNDLEAMARAARDTRPSPTPVPEQDAHLVAVRLGQAVTRTLRVLPADSRCLIRSLIVMRLMSRRTIPGRLVVGVQAETKFEAHAWVEHDALPVTPAGTFERLIEL